MFFRLYLPPGSGRLRQPATIDPTLDLCTRYPLRLGGPRQCGIRSLPDASTHGQHWESNPRPSDLESNALSTWPRAPTWRCKYVLTKCACVLSTARYIFHHFQRMRRTCCKTLLVLFQRKCQLIEYRTSRRQLNRNQQENVNSTHRRKKIYEIYMDQARHGGKFLGD